MANTTADYLKSATIEDISFASGGSLTNDIAIVIKEGITKEEAVLMLQRAIDNILNGETTLQ